MATNSEVLHQVPLFAGMTAGSLERIAELARETSYDQGAVIVREGEPGEFFVVILSGAATVEQDGRTLNSLGAGQFLGEIALIDGGSRTATVTATEPIQALLIDRPGFQRLMDEYPVVRHDLVSALTQRLRQRAPAPLD
jgi:CRP/FNR family cyclic AMP-dependent transcriptional regulator